MEKIFFIGIGGIGMSSLAVYAKHLGYYVAGSDQDLFSNTIQLLKKSDIEVIDENLTTENDINNFEIIVITNTVKNDHRLYILSKKLNKTILLRSQFLGHVTNNKKIIGITGSHGKTTTTSIIGHIFQQSKMNPTVKVGGIMKNYDTNLLIGNSDYLILEADDAWKSFLDINPFISIITSISYEHLEVYKDLDDIEKTFLKYAEKTSKDGIIVINNDSAFLKKFIKKINHSNIITYGTSKDSDYVIKNINLNKNTVNFSLFFKNDYLDTYNINLFGIHNIKNTTAAIIVGLHSKINNENIKNSLISYKGVERRFEYTGYCNNINVYDDYAHHPIEINYMLSILETKNIKAYIFFQPHKYVRTKHLWNEFINVFLKYKKNIETLYITDVYSAGDPYDEIFNSENLVKSLQPKLKNIIYVPFDYEFKNLLSYKKDLILNSNNTIILTLGAGLMNRFNNLLIK